MKLRPEMTGEALTRLKRARGQLNAVIEMMENGEDCRAALTQLAAVSKAIDRAGYKIIASGMRHCNAARENGDTPEMTEEELEKLFLALA
ncbi:metal-sensitive transcriptional regulator [Micromonospora coxensis]|uniref:DNA-binding transcriptional regulator, FrmR family n=1 Tax=Micromonospora coxensis TaxID=356852 RepID=A0A1C5JW97_9ACTN|nr:metal-sensitive transcriptional regulator [Micromonospora coxensis]SCG74519.1 DNA-binding transcriptional regulator, FrmR family [Micromonospora coxensis]